MAFQLPDAGSASSELAREVHIWWQDAAVKTDIDLSGFDPGAPLDERVAWALELGLEIGTVYSRFSSKKQQHSTADQMRTCVQHAATKGIYCPPEFACVDEAQQGYRARREGLERMKMILKQRCAPHACKGRSELLGLVIVSPMGVKPSPSGDPFRIPVSWLDG